MVCDHGHANHHVANHQPLHLQALPPELADELLKAVLQAHESAHPGHLGHFQGCITTLDVCISGARRRTASAWLRFAAGAPHLRALHFDGGGERIADQHVLGLAALAGSLRELTLVRCRGISPPCLADTLAQLTALTMLKLDALTSPAASASLPHLASLQSLALDGMDLGEHGRAALSRLTDLRTLQLHWCRGVDDSAVEELGALPALAALELSNAQCHAPPAVPSLTSLDMSGCTLDVVGETAELVWLDLRCVPPRRRLRFVTCMCLMQLASGSNSSCVRICAGLCSPTWSH